MIQQLHDVVNTVGPLSSERSPPLEFEGHLALLGALVDRFHGLEGEFDAQRGGAFAVGGMLAVPDQPSAPPSRPS